MIRRAYIVSETWCSRGVRKYLLRAVSQALQQLSLFKTERTTRAQRARCPLFVSPLLIKEKHLCLYTHCDSLVCCALEKNIFFRAFSAQHAFMALLRMRVADPGQQMSLTRVSSDLRRKQQRAIKPHRTLPEKYTAASNQHCKGQPRTHLWVRRKHTPRRL